MIVLYKQNNKYARKALDCYKKIGINRRALTQNNKILILYKIEQKTMQKGDQKQRKRIFLSNMDSKLGYHLVQALRDDHIKLNNCSIIVGSSCPSQSKYASIQNQQKLNCMHHAAHAMVSYDKDPVLFAKFVLESDVIVLDVRQASQQIQYAIKLIQLNCKVNKSYQNKSIIAISSFMTYAYQKHTTNNKISKRVPNHNWVYQHQLQQQIISLNKYENINACVIIPGLIYGIDFPSPELEILFVKCWQIQQQVSVQGDGNNVLPTVCVIDFCDHVLKLLGLAQSGKLNGTHEYFSIDSSLMTQMQIVQLMLKNSGLIKQIGRTPIHYLDRNQQILSTNMDIQPSKLLPTSTSISTYLQSYNPHQYFTFQPHHLILYTQQHDPTSPQNINSNPNTSPNTNKNIEQVIKHLQSVITVYKQDQIIQQIMEQKNIGQRADVDIHQIRHRIQVDVFDTNPWQNYVVVVDHVLFDVEVVRKYQLAKLEFGVHLPMLLRYQYPQYVQGCFLSNHQTQTNNRPSSISSHPHPQLSTSHQSTNNHGNDQNVHPNLDSNQKCDEFDDEKNVKQKMNKNIDYIQEQRKWESKQQQIRRMKHKEYRKIDQYLLDNVIGYLAEAFLEINNNKNRVSKGKNQLQLSEFVDELKKIYERENLIYTEQSQFVII